MTTIQISKGPVNLCYTLGEMAVHPLRTLVPPWSWKATAFAATVRGSAFFIANLRAGEWQATKALVVEAVFALIVSGSVGAISQQLRRAEPLWATVLVVWIGLPGLMLIFQLGVHRIANTPHQSGNVALSFSLTSISSAFSWYAMRNGAMLGGIDQTTMLHDLAALPKILLNFLLAGPKFAASALRRKLQV